MKHIDAFTFNSFSLVFLSFFYTFRLLGVD